MPLYGVPSSVNVYLKWIPDNAGKLHDRPHQGFLAAGFSVRMVYGYAGFFGCNVNMFVPIYAIL